MAHLHSVYDTDPHFQIDGVTRSVKNASSTKTVLIQHDHNSERFTFEIPRMIDGHDMSTCNVVQIHYINIDSTDKSKQYSGIYEVEDLQISPDSNDVVICSWLISANATQYVGNLSFVVRFACTSDYSIDYAWNTAIHSNVYVSKGICNSDVVVETYADILEQWRDELFNGTGSSVGNVDLSGYVKSVNGKTPDASGNVEITIPDSSQNANVATVEPAEDDIPKVYFGGALQQTKDEKVVPFRYISKTEDISGYAEIKAQGNSSMSYAKKNQTVKLFKDAECTEKLKVDFKGWGKQNKHVYKANWIDLSHARNVVSARLWADVVKSRANYAELPELLRTSPNQGAVDGFPVKVYAAGIYQGRYTLNIPKDKWTFNMDDKLDEHCVLCGENYVSGCFRAAANINGNDWTDEIHDTVPASIKTRWNQVISFVMNSTDDEFRANLNQYFYVDSLIDYYLFGLASCGLDAFGKNQIYATYDGQKWIASMYDMDSTWGLYWNGGSFVATDYPRTSYEDWKNAGGNLLYIRMEQLFYAELQARWAELKNGALSVVNIINRFERFTDIAPAELVKEDYASTTGGGKFTGIPSQSTNNIQQIRAFALARQAWTDSYIAALTPAIPVPCEGITLDKNALTFTAEGAQNVTATIIPDGCTDNVIWVCSDPSVATISVNGYVCTVEAIANGNATVTATCGNYSASCSVAVSGIAEPVPCTAITLDKTSLTFNSEGSQTITATVTPSNTTDRVVWGSNNESVATVEDGVVMPVADGSAIITATCGNQSASCFVVVSGVRDAFVLYRLAEETVFNGSSTFIDTGVQLCDSDKDFAVAFSVTPSRNNTNGMALLHCMNETDGYPGVAFDTAMNKYRLSTVSPKITDIPATTSSLMKGVLMHKAGSGVYTLKISNGCFIYDYSAPSDGTHSQNLLIGCYQTVSGTKGRFWAGTVHECTVWNRLLTDEEIAEFVALPTDPEPVKLYELAEPVTFNGTSDYVDTGVQLFDEYKNFTVYIRFKGAEGVAQTHTAAVLDAAWEGTGYPGFYVRYLTGGNKYSVSGTTNASNLTDNDTAEGRIVIRRSKDSDTVSVDYFKNNTQNSATVKINDAVFAENVLLGARQEYNGTLSKFWAGTVYECEIYNYVVGDEDVGALLS